MDATYLFSGGPFPGEWSTAPSIANPSVIAGRSSHTVGKTLKATYKAVGTGTTLVEALFLQRCAPTDKTPCTVPPQIATILQLTVVSAVAAPIVKSPLSTSVTVPGSSSSLSAVLPLVVCPTTYGASPPTTVILPSTISESVPRDLATQLAMYTDRQGFMKLLGPTGWSCAANFGADGSGGVQVYPAGQSNPVNHQSASSDLGIVGTQNGGCVGCAVTQASRLFAAALSQCESEFPGDAQACPSQPPAGESTEPIAAGVVGFLDPPGIAGDGNPSGGQYPANGVMTFQTQQYTTSFLDTCTLPSSEHALCTAALDNFVQLYGTA